MLAQRIAYTCFVEIFAIAIITIFCLRYTAGINVNVLRCVTAAVVALGRSAIPSLIIPNITIVIVAVVCSGGYGWNNRKCLALLCLVIG